MYINMYNLYTMNTTYVGCMITYTLLKSYKVDEAYITIHVVSYSKIVT